MNESTPFDLAYALSSDGYAWLYEPGGSNALQVGVTPVALAESIGGAYVIRLRPGVIALDLDDGWTDAAEAAVQQYRGVGCGVVRCTSGGKAGVAEHVFICGPPQWSCGDLEKIARQAGLPGLVIRASGERVRMRPPLSPHRSGGMGRLIEPSTIAEALVQLQVGQPRDVAAWVTGAITDEQCVPDKYRSRGGSVERNRLVYAVALAYANAGHTYELFRQALDSAYPKLRDKITSMGAAGKLRYEWQRACSYVREHPPQVAGQTYVDLRSALSDASRWCGRTGRTDRNVYRFLVGLAEQIGSREVGASLRRISEQTGCAVHTVGKSLQRLHQVGLVQLVSRPSGRDASTYELLPVGGESDGNEHNSLLYRGNVVIVSVDPTFTPTSSHDVWRGRNGLGAQQHTYEALTDTYQTTAQITARLPVTVAPATVRAHLKQLCLTGLAERNTPTGHTWRLNPDAPSLDLIAERYGTAGHGERQRTRHEQERQLYSEQLSDPYSSVAKRRRKAA